MMLLVISNCFALSISCNLEVVNFEKGKDFVNYIETLSLGRLRRIATALACVQCLLCME